LHQGFHCLFYIQQTACRDNIMFPFHICKSILQLGTKKLAKPN
jgi:hypothetical protein